MWIILFIFGFISIVSDVVGLGLMEKKSWTYEIKSIETTSSDTDLLNIELRKERLSRGLYAISGEFFLKFDIFENDGNTFSAKSYRSSMGDGDYKTLPFQLPPTDMIAYLNSYYKDTLMESLHGCSDLPYFKDKFVPPFAKKQYTFNSCQFSQDGFPNYLQEGMYKLVIIGNGTVSWQIVLIAEVQSIV